MAQRKHIVSGPSKFDLMLSLFDSRGDIVRMVEFTVLEGGCGVPQRRYANIALIQREDGSGESWNIEGSLFIKEKECYDLLGNFKGYFSTQDRKGTMTMTESRR